MDKTQRVYGKLDPLYTEGSTATLENYRMKAYKETLITARLENWHSEKCGEGEFRICGNIYNDEPIRNLPDGMRVHTSKIIAAPDHVFKEGDIVQTRNSNYLLGKSREVTRTEELEIVGWWFRYYGQGNVIASMESYQSREDCLLSWPNMEDVGEPVSLCPYDEAMKRIKELEAENAKLQEYKTKFLQLTAQRERELSAISNKLGMSNIDDPMFEDWMEDAILREQLKE